MDPKALAKSKRAHTQHGRANHPSPSAIAQRKKESKDKKPMQATAGRGRGGGGEEAPKRPSGHSLLSNWDRYEEEDEVGGPDNLAATEVAPKSKGADFRYLLEQAREQEQERDKLAARGIALPSSSEELPFGLMQGLSSILSVRGKDMLSLCADDNFIIDDDAPLGYEVPFLSIDLKAMDAQLSKLKLSERLFVEADLFPEDQCVDGLKEDQLSEQFEASVGSELKYNSAPPASINVDDQNYNRNHYINSEMGEVASLKNYQSQNLAGDTTNVHQAKELKLQDSSSSRTQGSDSGVRTYAVSNPTENSTSRFEVEAAEAELDMLLDSLKRNTISSTADQDRMNNVKSQQKAPSNSSTDTVPFSTTEHSNSCRNAGVTSIDDSLDDLLAETSSRIKEQISETIMKEGTFYPRNNKPLQLVLGSKLVEGSSILRTNAIASLDDALDDLLGETSVFLKDQKQEPSAVSLPSVSLPSKPLGSKTMDDFDSWLDNL
ncbi:hypothetical protein Cni_G23305 [Canna indica]|uniref:Uncharacterized protein n=1 Tax=Canna indica TaxID=4628 RepID=A0AAQ3KU51_9LILI|nr:hypothetical protein Cni_G23305 [Canna indica]